MGCGSVKKTLNPIRQVKTAAKAGVSLAKGNVKTGFKQTISADAVYQANRYKISGGVKGTKSGLKNPYVATAATAVATYYGGPLAGAAVSSAATAVQQREAQKQAQRQAAEQQAAFDNTFSNLGESLVEGLAPPEPDADLAQPEEDTIAQEAVDRRFRRRRVTRTLLSPALGSSTASLSKPVLLGA